MSYEKINRANQFPDKLIGARFSRLSAATICLGTMVALWWQLASNQSPGKILGFYSTRTFSVLLVTSYFLLWFIYIALSSEKLSGKTARVALSTLSLLTLFALLELPALLGVIDYRRVISPPESFLVTQLKPWDNPANLLDGELMHLHRSGQKIHGETTGDMVKWLGISTDRRYPVDISYDRNGFRNDRDIQKAPVVVIGDSFVEGVLVPQAALVSSKLKQQLGVEVANLGQSGYGPQQELAVMKRFGSKLNPRVVLWFFFEGNDLLDVPRYQEFIRNREEIMRTRDTFFSRSFVRNVLFTLSGLTGPKPDQDGSEARRRSGQFVSAQSGSETLYFAYPGEPLTETDLKSLKTAQNYFLEAQKFAQNSGARLVLVYVPTKFRIYGSYCSFPEDGYGRRWQVSDLPQRMETWSREKGILYLDLTPGLKEAASRGELVYLLDDGHWSERGHQITAETLARFIESGGWLAAQ